MNNFETAKQFFFEGLQLLQANNLQAAETQFERSLEIIPERISTLNNLSAVKIKLSKFGEAEDLARKAVALEENSPEAWSNLATALGAAGRDEDALLAADRAIQCNSSYAMAWLAKAAALRDLKRYDEALLACEQALRLDPDKYEILFHKSLILKELNRLNEAHGIYRRALDLRVAVSPVFIGERCATQKAEALIINPDPYIDDSFHSFENLSRFCPNFPSQLADHLHEDFHFNYLFISNVGNLSARKQIPQPDFIVNNHVNGEMIVADGSMAGLKELLESFRVPVVNHPAKVMPTIRDMSAKLLDGIPGAVVPRTARFSSVGKPYEQLADEIEVQFDYPLITRRLTSQEGKGMNKVDSRKALIEVLSAGCPDQFFVTEFVDCRKGTEFHRKIRVAVVKDEILIVRVDYDTYWNVHGRKAKARVPFYLEHRWVLDEEKRIINDPEAELGRPATQALRTIRERIPMDVFGIDLAVDPDGLLVFYEANATMNLFCTAHTEVRNPIEADERLKDAFQRYFTSLLTHR